MVVGNLLATKRLSASSLSDATPLKLICMAVRATMMPPTPSHKLMTKKGLAGAWNYVEQVDPDAMIVAFSCSPWSQMQNSM